MASIGVVHGHFVDAHSSLSSASAKRKLVYERLGWSNCCALLVLQLQRLHSQCSSSVMLPSCRTGAVLSCVSCPLLHACTHDITQVHACTHDITQVCGCGWVLAEGNGKR